MILITSAKYLPIEFQLEIGKLPPSFLPLGGKRLYEYQTKLFCDLQERIILSLPMSFNLDKADEVKLAELGVETLFVPEHLTLGESIVYCLNMNMPIKETLRILHGDTYFDFLAFGDNSLTINQVENNYDWEYFSKDFKSENSFANDNPFIISGYFEIKNTYVLVQSILKSGYDYIQGLKLYSQKYPFFVLENETWKDFGIVASYFYYKRIVTTQRVFNRLVIKDGYCFKSSDMDFKIAGEIEWFRNFPKNLDLNIPRFHNIDSSSYKIEYLYLNTLSEIFVFGRLPAIAWHKIFLQVKSFLDKLHSIETSQKVDVNYSKKTKERLQCFLKSHHLNEEILWKIDGLKVSLAEILKDIDSCILSPKHFGFIHGDFCFSNIMYDFKSNRIKTFDPRGLDFSGKVTPFGDARYDVAKLAHSCLGLYDFIIAGLFECEIKDYEIKLNILAPQTIVAIQEIFLEIFCPQNKKEIYCIMIHLFLSMLPLHADDPKRQMGLFANAFRLYVEFCRLKDSY